MRTASKFRLCCCGRTAICEVTVLTLQHWMPRETRLVWPSALQVKITGRLVNSSSSHALGFLLLGLKAVADLGLLTILMTDAQAR
jgi:hypothetical protein